MPSSSDLPESRVNEIREIIWRAIQDYTPRTRTEIVEADKLSQEIGSLLTQIVDGKIAENRLNRLLVDIRSRDSNRGDQPQPCITPQS